MDAENTAAVAEETQHEVTPEAPAEAAPAEAPAPANEDAEPVEAAADEGEADEAPEPGAPAETPEQKHKRAGGWRRKLERLERENRALMARLMGEVPQPAPTQAPKEKTPEEKTAEWVDSLVEKRLAQKEAERRHAEAQAALQRRTLEFKALHPDFDDVLMSADVPVSQVVSEALLTSEQGPAIMYALASNPAELARLSALPPLDAVREIGRLEARLASSTAAPAKPNPVAARKPAAPAPIAPVTARGPSKVKDPGSMSYEEYSAWRESQRKR